MKQQVEFHSPDDEQLYEADVREVQSVDLEQVNQFQPEFEPRSTSSATTDLYASSQIEAHRHRDQGDPNDYDSRFENQ